MFSQKVEYALRAVVYLAHEVPSPRTVEQIARAAKVPQAYLAKVIQELVHAGITRSQRGIGGGISLARSPDDLTLLEVVNAVDPIRRNGTCPLELVEHAAFLCPLHQRMDNAVAQVEGSFRSTTLADLVVPRADSAESCPYPAIGKDE